MSRFDARLVVPADRRAMVVTPFSRATQSRLECSGSGSARSAAIGMQISVRAPGGTKTSGSSQPRRRVADQESDRRIVDYRWGISCFGSAPDSASDSIECSGAQTCDRSAATAPVPALGSEIRRQLGRRWESSCFGGEAPEEYVPPEVTPGRRTVRARAHGPSVPDGPDPAGRRDPGQLRHDLLRRPAAGDGRPHDPGAGGRRGGDACRVHLELRRREWSVDPLARVRRTRRRRSPTATPTRT